MTADNSRCNWTGIVSTMPIRLSQGDTMASVGRCSRFVPALDIGHLSTRRSTASPRGGAGGAWVHPNAPANPRPRDGRRQGRNTRYRGHLKKPDRHGFNHAYPVDAQDRYW